MTAAAIALAAVAIGGQAAAATRSSGPPWYFSAFDMNDVWKITSGGQVVVAVVSGGVGSPAGMLQDALIPGSDVSSDGGAGGTADVLSAYDGTQVAALIAAKAASPVQGMAPGASILPVRDIAKGEQSSDAAETSRGIRYAADHGAAVIVVVDTAPRMDGSVAAAVAHAESKNAIVIAPSGNTGQSGNVVNAVCSFDGVLCVGATSPDGKRWPNSASGPKIDLAAPGVQVTVPTASGGTRLGSSTHYSAALVAAEAALIRSAHPTWSAGQVVRVMLQNTDGGRADHTRAGDAIGYGIIKPLAAVKAAQPSNTANPLSTASARASSPAPAPSHAGRTAAASGSSRGSGSGNTLLIVGAALGGLVVIGLVAWILLRSRSRRRNYLTDPAYGAGYFGQDPGPTSQIGGYQGWNSPPQVPPYPPAPAAPPPFQPGQDPQSYWGSQQAQQGQPPQPPPEMSEAEIGRGYTQPFAGEPLASQPWPPAGPWDAHGEPGQEQFPAQDPASGPAAAQGPQPEHTGSAVPGQPSDPQQQQQQSQQQSQQQPRQTPGDSS
ncbi:S8 family serine peptidase [Actinocrinis puniceicyclus]|uniref:S8 family serine peptidase n=1 Tax=Actinocrinis puniceicyclus TaxID=977794 RepID=A0A8J7WRY7_9ACTN|nr:S8 family serine peptidase [Actinocrinis puniceicyclus]MBS2964485.1 S8 family serine peptidase [Actinocrinis puniceicyclus]